MRKVSDYVPLNTWNGILLVGEWPDNEDELQGKPFQGYKGKILSNILREAGINPNECHMTHVVKYVPTTGGDWLSSKMVKRERRTTIKNDDELVHEGVAELAALIEQTKPQIVIGLGNAALWACTDEWGVDDWRGSEMTMADGTHFVPTLNPAKCIQKWINKGFMATDMKLRVQKRLRSGFETPVWNLNIAPTLRQVKEFCLTHRGPLSVDVETSRGQIVCIGMAWTDRDALVIPFISEGYGAYWSAEDRNDVLWMVQTVLTKPTTEIIGQNFNYDASYFYDNFGYIPRVRFDTLIAQSVLFPGLPRGLGFLSSMYCRWHTYWKDDARDWQNLRDFAGLFTYNGRDVCATFEVAQVIHKLVSAAGLTEPFEDRMRYNHSVFDMMFTGVERNAEKTQELDAEIEIALQERALIVNDAAGYPVNITSPVQVSKLLYTEWECRKPKRKSKADGGTGDEELTQVAAWHPERAEVLTAILEHRSLASMRNNFLRAELDPDGRLRSGFMATGTETFRLTSSKNNFRRGTNLLNISGGGTTHSGNKVPNFKCAITPPSGHTFFDTDCERADLCVVVWEADDADLKAKIKEGADIHYENAKDVFGVREPSSAQREKAKTFVHLTDYAGAARTCAIKVGCTVHEADMAQRRWFAAHPGIKKWHERTSASLANNRTIKNAFGYRIVFFERVEGLLPAALAWLPQSTIAIVTSKVHMAFEQIPGVTVGLNVYDSVAGWYPTVEEDRVLLAMSKANQIVVPYDDPLIVPMGLKTSTISYGDCEKRKWLK